MAWRVLVVMTSGHVHCTMESQCEYLKWMTESLFGVLSGKLTALLKIDCRYHGRRGLLRIFGDVSISLGHINAECAMVWGWSLHSTTDGFVVLLHQEMLLKKENTDLEVAVTSQWPYLEVENNPFRLLRQVTLVMCCFECVEKGLLWGRRSGTPV